MVGVGGGSPLKKPQNKCKHFKSNISRHKYSHYYVFFCFQQCFWHFFDFNVKIHSLLSHFCCDWDSKKGLKSSFRAAFYSYVHPVSPGSRSLRVFSFFVFFICSYQGRTTAAPVTVKGRFTAWINPALSKFNPQAEKTVCLPQKSRWWPSVSLLICLFWWLKMKFPSKHSWFPSAV